ARYVPPAVTHGVRRMPSAAPAAPAAPAAEYGRVRTLPAPASARVPAVTIPQGYRRAWEDDRLNPARGPRTAAGNAQTARIWTDTVPREARPTVTVPARAIAQPAIRGHVIQVASFAQPGNAAQTARRMQALGLPATIRRQGGLQVVLAGPVAAGDAAAALAAVRRAGFHDAFLR
ncbi:SPOR domain-containing protein, partial [Palleronia sediminis]